MLTRWNADVFERVLVTSRALHAGCPFAASVAAAAARHEATLIVVREKDLTPADLEPLVRATVAAASVPVVVAHHVEVAVAARAAGVHLGWNSPSVAEARKILEPQALIGVSVHDVNEGVTRAAEGADYLFLGPVNATPKSLPVTPIGLGPIRDLADRVAIPVVAIGGLTAADLHEVLAAGGAGIAGIRAFG